MYNILHKDFSEREVLRNLLKKFSYRNIMEVPRIKKVVLNIGFGRSIIENKKCFEFILNDLELISTQKPLMVKAKKSISSFKIRSGMIIGAKVTLRRKKMWNFLKRLVCIAIPRIRDFRGLPKKSFDNQGNYNIGIREQIIFPEINYDNIDKVRGLDVNITTSANTAEEGFILLSAYGFPFRESV